jgi:hypothetical protein
METLLIVLPIIALVGWMIGKPKGRAGEGAILGGLFGPLKRRSPTALESTMTKGQESMERRWVSANSGGQRSAGRTVSTFSFSEQSERPSSAAF